MHLDRLKEDFWYAAREEGITDFSPKNLARFDEVLSDMRVTLAELGCPDPDLGTLWYAYAMLGSYFGEALVHNLSGRWKYPSFFVAILGLVFGRPDWIYRRWYVVVGDQKVPVFVIAMRRHTLGREKASLVRAYEEIAATVRGREHERRPVC